MSDIKKLSDLQPDTKNANKGTARGIKMIEASLQEDGFGRSVLIDKSGHVIAGNKTIEAVANTFGVDTEVILVKTTGNQVVAVQREDLDLTDSDPNSPARRLAYRDNLTHEFSFDLDPDVVMGDIEAGFDFEAIDIKIDDLGDLMNKSIEEMLGEGGKGKDTPPQAEKAEELRQKWGVEVGQMWQLGPHRLICGDCTDSAVVERVMDGERAALFVTDPPYAVSYADKNRFLNSIGLANRIEEPIVNDHLSLDDVQKIWFAAAKNALDNCVDIASYYWFACQGGDLMMMMMMIGEAGWKVRHELIWVKNNHVLGRSDYNYKHEPILYGWKKDGTHKYYGGFQTSVLEFDKPQKSDLHPTMKPVELIEFLVNNSTQKDDIVLDTFLGSGTTLIACDNLGRQCRAVEISPGYIAVTLQRWADHTGQTPELK